MFDFKNKLSLKKTLITTICLMFVFSLSGVLACLVNASNHVQDSIPTVQEVEPVSIDSDLIEQQGFSLGWNNDEDKKVIKPLAVTQPSEEKKYFVTTSDNFPDKIEAGTLIIVKSVSYGNGCDKSLGTLSCSGHHCEITLYSSEDDLNNETNNVGQAFLHFDKGLRLEGLKLGYYNNGSVSDRNFVSLYSFDTEIDDYYYLHDNNNEIVDYVTPEDLDPNYTGQLAFVPITEYMYYPLKLFTTETGSDYRTAHYTVAGQNLENYEPLNVPTGFTHEGWLINTSKIDNLNLVKEENNLNQYIKHDDLVDKLNYKYFDDVTNSQTMDVTFTYSDKFEINGNTYYIINYVQGYGNFGNAYQDEKIITAKFAKSYNLTLDNSGAYWSGFNDTKSDSTFYGAVSSIEQNGTDDGDFTKTTLTIDKTTETDFVSSNDDNSFNKFENLGTGLNYCFYNYGHKYSKIKISITYDETTKFLDSSLTLTNTEPEVNISDLSNKTFGDLAKLADLMVAYNDISLKIAPIWEAESIVVKDLEGNVIVDSDKDGEADADGKISFASEYSLTKIEDPSFVCYKVGEQYIAIDAVWNYSNIAVGNDGYVYDSANKCYTLTVEPVYLDNLYRVDLNGLKTNLISEVYSLVAGTPPKSDYIVGGEVSNLTEWTAANYPLVDSYIEVLVNEINEANESVGSSSDLTKKVFKDGTKNFIYLADNSNINDLLFANNNAQTIAWVNKNNSTAFTTSAYNNDFSNELGDAKNSTATTWNYNENNIELTAVYVYGLDLYYLNNAGAYSTMQAQWYGGAKTTLTIDEVPTNIPAGKAFVSWMINKENAEAQDYDVTASGTTLTLTKDGKTTTFTFEDLSGNYYYGISAVYGNAVFVQDPASPIVVARYSGNTYQVTVDNSCSDSTNNSYVYWSSFNETKTDSMLFGAVSSSELNGTNDNNFKTTTFQIADTENNTSAYPFQTNTGFAFYKHDDLINSSKELNVEINSQLANNDFYFVYNYGHEISGWKVQATLNGTTTKFIFNGTNWSNWQTGSEVSTDLSGQTLQNLANYLDGYYPSENDEIAVKLTPVWQSAKIKVVNNSETIGEFDYTHSVYSLNNVEDTVKEEGCRTLFAYQKDDKLISTSGVWNYRNFSFEDYNYRNNKHEISVEPVFVDNIIRVNLYGVLSNTEHVLENTDYEYRSQKYQNASYSFKTYTGNSYLYKSYENYSEDKYLIEYYIDALSGYLEDWENGIGKDEEGDFTSILKKIQYNALSAKNPEFWIYLVDGITVSQLPMFKHDNAQIIAWDYGSPDITRTYKTNGFENDGDDNNDNDIFENELIQNRVEVGGNWSYNENSLTAHYVYKLDLYYEDNNSSDGVYSKKQAEWYGANTNLDISDDKYNLTEEDGTPNNKEFDSWMVVVANAETSGYTLSQNDSNKTITLTKSGVVINFKFNNSFKVSESSDIVYYYGISDVNGNAILDQNSTTPIVLAKYNSEYALTVNNTGDVSSVYWKNNDATNSSLYGAVSSSELNATDDNNFKITNFIISNNADYAYPFQTNTGFAFYKHDDLINSSKELNVEINSQLANNDFYFVYNYGHEISGWKVIGTHYNEEDEHYIETSFVFNGTSWHVGGSNGTIITTLFNQTLQTLSAYLDGYYARMVGEITITLAPIWEAVSFDIITTVKNSGTFEDWNVKKVTYATAYSGLTYRDNSEGQTLFAYRLAGDANNVDDYKLISTSGVWNYRDFSFEDYVYENDEYSFMVEPVFVDNIYKILLQNVKPNKFNVDNTKDEYVLDANCDYIFNSEKGTYDVGNKYVFKYSDYAEVAGSDYVYESYANETLVDDYILNLKSYLSNWIKGISDSENLFEILRKVYYSDGELQDGKLIADLSSSDDYLCVYLANNQKTGKLPAFDKDDYVHILWKNTVSVQSKNYIYLTNKYESDSHIGEIKSEYCWHGENLEVDSIWNYSDGYDTQDSYIPKFEAKYFRGYIQVEISTLFDSQLTNAIESNIARRGYVMVNITDNLHLDDNAINNMGGNFIVIAEQVSGTNDYNMKVYQIIKNETFTSILNYWDSTNNKMLISNDSLVGVSSILQLYTGCSIAINVKDQGKDSTAMASGEFDEMIGYKYKETIQTENPIFATFDSSDYAYSETNENILNNYGHYFKNNEIVKIDIYFTEILYNLSFAIDNVSAGKFNVRANQYHATNTSRVYLVENIKVGGLYQVEYFANAGYKLQNQAFTLLNRVNIEPFAIQHYDENEYKTSVEAGTPNEELISQIYTLTTGMNSSNYLDAGWLRTYFYSDNNFGVNLEDGNLGTITINTDVIEFNYGVKIYDSYTNTTIETKENKGTIRLDSAKGTAQFVSVKGILGTELNNNAVNGDAFWHYTSSSNINYALISSRMYFPNNMVLESHDNYWKPYSFLLLEEPNGEYTLSSSHLARMVESFDTGKIISNINNNRNIYMMLEVRELIKIDLKVKHDELDSNDTTRTIFISNGTRNSKSLILNENESFTGSYFDKTLTLLSYKGLENYLNSDYTENRYTSVKYYLGSTQNPIQENMFIADSNKEVIVEFNPISLQVQYSYYLNSELKDFEGVSNYISETKPLATDRFALNHVVEYSVNILNDDYNLRVFINDNLMGTTSISTRGISCEYKVVRSDFDKNGITIRVEIFELDTTQISIRYQLFDLSKLTSTENYGTFSVYSKYLENPNEKLAEDVSSSTYVNIAEKRNVIIDLTYIPTGYIFKGYKHNTFAPVLVELSENNDFTLIEDFNPSQDSGDYVILLDKENVTASLNTSQSQIDYYKINGTNYLSNLYVGSIITFTSVEVNTERLDYFYYESCDKSSGTPVKKQEKIVGNSFTITSEVLESLEARNTINFKVAVINRYNLDLTIIGGQYLANDGFKTFFEGTETDYILGSYVDYGTKVTFKITPETIGKYDVKFNGILDADDEIKINEHIIELKQDYAYVIEISPKVYSVNVLEYVYENLADVDNGTPKEVESDKQVNGLDSSNKIQTYNNNTVLKFAKTTSDRELSKITISNNDMDKTIIITFDGDNYVATVDGNEIDLVDYGYTITVIDQGLNVRLSYVTYNNISINFEYKDYKIIEA